jgi:hypothetical protein
MINEHVTRQLDPRALLAFSTALGITTEPEPSLDKFTSAAWTDACIREAGNHFNREEEFLKRVLGPDGEGIAAVDMPECNELSLAQNTVAGAAGVVGLFGRIGSPALNPADALPFTLHRASHSDTAKMKQIGLDMFTPDAKLGFHNDGLVHGDSVELPLHIGIYNLLISYRNPGNFSWIPTRKWNESSKFEAVCGDASMAVVRLTPRMHFAPDGQPVKTGVDQVRVPLVFRNVAGQVRFFLNGDVTQHDNSPEVTRLFSEMKASISSADRVSILQKERRAIFLNNTAGFHARDIFEDPIPGVDLSRVFLRLVDRNSEFRAA